MEVEVEEEGGGADRKLSIPDSGHETPHINEEVKKILTC